VHDQADLNVTCEKRNVTTVPTQALTLLNNEFVLIQARHFADRVILEAGSDPANQVSTLYRIAFSRAPTAKESESMQAFIRKQQDYHKGAVLSALTDAAHVILNSNEFVYIN
jgi:hypothetical protein